ncbi:uncharacterized protein LOC113850520 [Abrus precatorius]|uniref:Uncharacterized protein LOC113850520 n=1 Tax=Abrus precatorius TaxID=3816 RepID=A0A8B8K1L6_ABRPR|nr:uncharacterized protein LOC113850520 [Abrus precatorius]
MQPLLRKRFFFLSSSSPSAATELLVQLQARQSSSSPHHESRNVRVSVWWDFKNCNVPAGVDASKVTPAITEAVRAKGIKGPLHINAFGDVQQLSKLDQEALAYTGVNFIHVPYGGRNSVNILVDIMFWVYQNPPPAHLFLISGDRDFAGILHRLRMNNYNILLASPGNAPAVLCSAATIMWQWSLLLKGENLIGKHFNHPPDGPLGSWYGNFKVRLENPFSAAVQSTSLDNEDVCEPSLDLELGEVSKSFVQQVKHILSSHPKGISITDLRAELIKCDRHLGKYFYGVKRFAQFLLSIPRVQLQPLEDGGFCVCLVPSESPEPFESSVVPSTRFSVKNEESENAATPKLNGEDKNKGRHADGTPSIASFHESSIDDDSKSSQLVTPQGKTIGGYVDGKSPFPSSVERHEFKPQNDLQKSSSASEKAVDVANTQLPTTNDKVSKTKMGSLRKRSKKSSDYDIVKTEDASLKIIEEHTTSMNNSPGSDNTTMENSDIADSESGNLEAKNNNENPTRKEVDEVFPSQNSSPVEDSMLYRRLCGIAETSGKSPTLFSWIRSWWPFRKSNEKSDDLSTCQNKVVSHLEDSKLSVSERDQTVSQFEEPKLSEQDQNASHSGKPELFSSDSFWNDMESFIFTPKGSLLVSQSKNREDMAHNLQNDGPLILRSLTEKDIFQLVELLIAEKKWLVESPSKPFPFKLTQSVQKNKLMDLSHGSNGLRSLFLSRTSLPNLQKSVERDMEKHNQSIPHTRVSATATETKYTERSRNDILEDCQKLVSDILREHPEGYNICSFRRLFVDRYGYHLDIQKLGHQKLTSLLKIFPGVKLDCTYIFPSVPAVCASDGDTSILKTQINNASQAVTNTDNESSYSAPKDTKFYSPREELSPVSVENSNQSDLESKLCQKANELDTSKHPDYEPIVSDYDASESDGDYSYLTQPEEQGKRKCNELDSSFWQALDSWHRSKKGEKSVSDNVGLLSNLESILNSSNESTPDKLSKTPTGNCIEKQRSQKNCSFVDDPVFPDKDRLVDGILKSFKKQDESKILGNLFPCPKPSCEGVTATARISFMHPAMRLLLRKNHLFMSSFSYFVRIEARELSSSSSRNVKVSVWWDFENCSLPADINASKVAPAITEAVRANGINGPLSIHAFGDVLQLSKANQDALFYTGIHFTHIPGGKNSADRFLLVDLLRWVSENPPPAHLLLISSDGDFAGVLHRLRMNNYNILLASTACAPDVLCSAATIMWHWFSLLKGEDIFGKHFNHPPDGLLGSWYGNYKVTLDSPFKAGEQSTSLQNVEICKPSLDLKAAPAPAPAPVPNSVVRQVWRILKFNPKGISITALRAELTRRNVQLDRKFYGYKVFSRFLSSLPCVQVKPLGDGKFRIHLVPSESPEPVDSKAVQSIISAVKIDERGNVATPKLNGEDRNKASEANETPSTASIHERSMGDDSKSFQPVTSLGRPIEEYVDVNSSVCSEKVVDMATAQLSLKDSNVSKTETGSLKTNYKESHDSGIVGPEDACHKILEKCTSSRNHSENFRAMNKYENTTRKEVDEVCHSPYSSSIDYSLVEKRPDESAETDRKGPTFFSWTKSWWSFWKNKAKSGDSTAHQNEVVSDFEDSNLSELDQRVQTVSHFKEGLSEMEQNVIHSGMLELFSSGSFWNEIESFLFTPKGSHLVSQSITREDMAHKLHKDGTLVLRSLTENDILQLVELLIVEKKWLEESPSQAFPFRLTQSAWKNSFVGQSQGANGLSSLFVSRPSQSNLQKSVEHNVKKHNHSIPQTKVSTTVTETKYTKRSRNEILQDSQKLLSEMLREHPEGYNFSSFKGLFVDRYGYHLDLQKLGYQNLASFLQIMPGVKVESTHIFPSVSAGGASDGETCILRTQSTNASDAHAVSYSDSELSDSAPKDGNAESPWEELGPVSVNNSNQSYLEPKLSQKATELDSSKHPDYESVVSDSDYSESEGNSSCLTQPEEPGQRKCNEQDSSSWQALDSLPSRKKGVHSAKMVDNVELFSKSLSLLDVLNSQNESTQHTPSKIPSGNFIKKERSRKNYSFVADPILTNNEDKLTDGILERYKKD